MWQSTAMMPSRRNNTLLRKLESNSLFKIAICIFVIICFGLGYLIVNTESTSPYNLMTVSSSVLEISTDLNLYPRNIVPGKIINADPRNLVFVWEMPVCGCGGFQTEIVDTVLGMYHANTVGRLAIMAPPSCWCPGLPEDTVEVLESLRQQPYDRWPVDVFVRHTAPPGYVASWPYLDISTRPPIVIGRSMCEIETVNSKWVPMVNLVDDVWVPSKHSFNAFVNAGVQPDNISIIHEPIESSLYNPSIYEPLPLPGLGGFNFLSIFKWEGRKGVDLLLRAFMEEFTSDDDVTLILQTHLFGSRNPYRPNAILAKIKLFISQLGLDSRPNAISIDRIIVISERLPVVDMLRLYKTADSFVLPTHGEGWGLPVIEAMMMGLPTIATDWSGIQEFLNEENGFPIRITGTEAATGIDFEHWMRWASPDFTHLKQQMRKVFSLSSQHRTQIGNKARSHLIQHFSREAIAKQVENRLSSLMTKFQVEGSFQMLANMEHKAERVRAKRLGLLGKHRAVGVDEDRFTKNTRTTKDMIQYYKSMKRDVVSEYGRFPESLPIDSDLSIPDTLFDPIPSYRNGLSVDNDIVKSMTNSFISAKELYLYSLPESTISSATDYESWESRQQTDEDDDDGTFTDRRKSKRAKQIKKKALLRKRQLANKFKATQTASSSKRESILRYKIST